MNSDVFSLLISSFLSLLVIIGFVRFSILAKKKDGSISTTYETLSRTNRSFIEQNVEVKANYIVEEEKSSNTK